MKVRKRKYPSGNVAWFIDLGKINGVRQREVFDTKGEAEAEMVRRRAELQRVGHQVAGLTNEEKREFVTCKSRLADVGATITEATDFFLKHAKPAAGEISVQDLIDLCLKAKEHDGHRPRYISQLKCSALSFARAGHENRPASEIAAADVESWLRSNQWAPKTWNVYLGDLRTVYQWALAQGYATMNPCEGVSRKKLDDGEIEFLGFEQVQKLLDRAAEWHPTVKRRNADGTWNALDGENESFLDCLGFVVLGMFCGLRPERELGLMSWEDVRDDVVVVSGHRAKTRGRRIVELPEIAREWLKLCPNRKGKILPKNFTKRWRRLRSTVGLLASWPHDAVRHTFATMHLAHFKDEKRLQILMGHEDSDLIYKHYRGMVTPAEAARFWDLRPRLWGKALLVG